MDSTVDLGSNSARIIVAVGASAGGLQALSTLLGELSTRSEAFAVVVAQHLSPGHDSQLPELLGRKTTWPVIKLEDETTLEPQRVYIIPPNRHAEWENGVIKFYDVPPNRNSPVPSVDRLFQSVAIGLGKYAIGVVLSGTGSDGTQGCQALKKSGGYVLLQTPQSAEQPHMIESVQQAKAYDKIVSPERIVSEIDSYIRNLEVVSEPENGETEFQRIIYLLAQKTGTDFTQYKASTLHRRLNKRIETLDLNTLGQYLTYIQEHPKELDDLFQTLLIGVTEFFRDETAFEALGKTLEELVQSKELGDSIRIWCVGCATGEEAYSIAMLLDEKLEDRIHDYNVQIFATDIDTKALSQARSGLYHAEQVSHLSEERLLRNFVAEEGGYRIRKRIRQMLLFSKHNVIIDTPFIRLDLISCRNLLIYFNTDLQREVIPVFHYALKEQGYLFLGKSENVSPFVDLFGKHDFTHKIFQRNLGVPINTVRFSRFRRKVFRPESPAKHTPDRPRSLMDRAHQALVSHYPHSFVIVNEQMEIHETYGDLRPFLEIAEGRLKAHLLHMINSRLHTEMRSTFLRVRKEHIQAESRPIRFRSLGQTHQVRIKVLPIQHKEHETSYYVVIFEMMDLKLLPDIDHLDREELTNLRIQELEHELAAAREHLQTFTEELETSNEELQSLNEEVQSANEELKSANEELETSNEELQSANEELQTSNSELRLSNEHLIRAEADLLASQEKLRLERSMLANAQKLARMCHWVYDVPSGNLQFSESFHQILSLDPNQSFPDLESVVTLYPTEEQRATVRQALRQAETFSFEFMLEANSHRSHRQYFMTEGRMLTTEQISNQSQRYIVTIRDITNLRNERQHLHAQNRTMERLMKHMPIHVFRYSLVDQNYRYSNQRLFEFIGFSQQEAAQKDPMDIYQHTFAEDRFTYQEWQAKHQSQPEEPLEIRFRVKRLDDRVVPMRSLLFPYRWNAQGEMVELLGLTEPVEEQ